MLQGALTKFDKNVFLRKICYRNGLIMCIVVHEARRQKQIWIVDKQSFIIYPGHFDVLNFECRETSNSVILQV